MIKPGYSLYRVLNQNPALAEKVSALHPAFARLKKFPSFVSVLISKVVTVSMAARMAGLSEENLIALLDNGPVQNSFDRSEEDSTMGKLQGDPPVSGSVVENGAPEKAFNHPGVQEVLFDVRPVIAIGGDPFYQIMEQAALLEKGQQLHLVNSFEPLPLYNQLEKRGYDYRSQLRDGVWHILISRSHAENIGDSELPPSGLVDITSAEIAEIVSLAESESGKIAPGYDLSDLPAPEPLQKILEVISANPDSQCFLFFHRREPKMLFPLLPEKKMLVALEHEGALVKIWLFRESLFVKWTKCHNR